MYKKYLIFFFLTISQSVYCQTKTYKISGLVGDLGNAKYAYLYIAGEPLIKELVINNRFKVEGLDTLKIDSYKFGYLFLDERDDISADEIKLNLERRIWTTTRPDYVKYIILEDICFEITSPDKIKEANIKMEGKLNELLAKSLIAAKSFKLNEFVLENSDSPMSLDVLSGIVKYAALTNTYPFGNPLELFNLLSERMKKTEKGKNIRNMIDDLEN